MNHDRDCYNIITRLVAELMLLLPPDSPESEPTAIAYSEGPGGWGLTVSRGGRSIPATAYAIPSLPHFNSPLVFALEFNPTPKSEFNPDGAKFVHQRPESLPYDTIAQLLLAALDTSTHTPHP